MPSTRDIRRRIKSVKNIQQITKAMEMVAAARLRRAQERAFSSRPYTEKIREVLNRVTPHLGKTGDNHPLLAFRDVDRVGYLVLSADKGLAGAYNSNILKELMRNIENQENFGLVTVGRKARDFFRRCEYPIDSEYIGISEKPTYQDAVKIARELTNSFADGMYDEIYIVYTQFISPMNHRPVTMKFLPLERPRVIDPEERAWSQGYDEEYLIEPSPREVIDQLLPRYIEMVVYGALLQSAASELGARMTAMSSATDNAKDLISQLVLSYNKVRQANITRELTEIVGGVEALGE